MITTFDSGELPETERLSLFNEFQLRCDDPMAVRADPAGFQARVRALGLADLGVCELACSAADVRRTSKLIRRADPELYSIIVPLRGRLMVAQGERDAELGTADIGLYSSSHPFQVRLAPGTTLLRAQLRRELLPLPVSKIDRLLATPLPGRSGVGALLSAFLTQLTGDVTYSPADATRLGSVAVDLLTAVLAHHLDTEAPENARQAALLPRITAFIQRHLDDPDLSPGAIAAAHHISVSYLHRLFQEQEVTVAAWIRRRRLDRAARDLADTGLRDLSIHRVAVRWGFTDHATFTRAFSAAYDVPPREYRRRALDRREPDDELLAS